MRGKGALRGREGESAGGLSWPVGCGGERHLAATPRASSRGRRKERRQNVKINSFVELDV